MVVLSVGLEPHLKRLVLLKHGTADRMGWSPALRARFGHYTPDDYYENCVDSLVTAGAEWIDVGGGDAIFPSNPRLAQALASRCKRLVVVDPSPNVTRNSLAHESVQARIEDFHDPRGFDVATMRMVVEHVAHPQEFLARLSRLIRPGGKAVVYTVDRRAPITLISASTPMWFHHAAKRFLWNTREEDTFPVAYRMNTRSCLRKLFESAGFCEVHFRKLDDCRTFAKWKPALMAELLLWKTLRSVGLHYPETCLLGVYERLGTPPPITR
jgi:ubiquinone/menaquinone biosynthesis C-methylase UbiE